MRLADKFDPSKKPATSWKQEASEVLTQLAFYTGWPNVFSAMPMFKDVIAQRAGS
jgi:alkylhydroperoxidase/carboxymuconolactone decarboxylase family protein YurZ